jgi:hypothetical protein
MAIFGKVIAVCREANPRLDIYRARFSALIPRSHFDLFSHPILDRDIMRTLQNPERPNANMSDAGEKSTHGWNLSFLS